MIALAEITKVMRIVILSAMSISVMVNVTQAAPNLTLQYLMSEPVTMLEWGFMKLREDFKNSSIEGIGRINVSISLDWGSSQIRILGSSTKEAGSERQAKDWCRDTIRYIRRALGVNPRSGEPVLEEGALIGGYFRHDGFVTSAEPENISSEIDGLTILEGAYSLQGDDIQIIRCRGPLIGTEIMYSQ